MVYTVDYRYNIVILFFIAIKCDTTVFSIIVTAAATMMAAGTSNGHDNMVIRKYIILSKLINFPNAVCMVSNNNIAIIDICSRTTRGVHTAITTATEINLKHTL